MIIPVNHLATVGYHCRASKPVREAHNSSLEKIFVFQCFPTKVKKDLVPKSISETYHSKLISKVYYRLKKKFKSYIGHKPLATKDLPDDCNSELSLYSQIILFFLILYYPGNNSIVERNSYWACAFVCK